MKLSSRSMAWRLFRCQFDFRWIFYKATEIKCHGNKNTCKSCIILIWFERVSMLFNQFWHVSVPFSIQIETYAKFIRLVAMNSFSLFFFCPSDFENYQQFYWLFYKLFKHTNWHKWAPKWKSGFCLLLKFATMVFFYAFNWSAISFDAKFTLNSKHIHRMWSVWEGKKKRSIDDCSKWRALFLCTTQKLQSSWLFKKGLKTIGLTAAIMTQTEFKCRDNPMWSILALCLSFDIYSYVNGISSVCTCTTLPIICFIASLLSDNMPHICTHNENWEFECKWVCWLNHRQTRQTRQTTKTESNLTDISTMKKFMLPSYFQFIDCLGFLCDDFCRAMNRTPLYCLRLLRECFLYVLMQVWGCSSLRYFILFFFFLFRLKSMRNTIDNILNKWLCIFISDAFITTNKFKWAIHSQKVHRFQWKAERIFNVFELKATQHVAIHMKIASLKVIKRVPLKWLILAWISLYFFFFFFSTRYCYRSLLLPLVLSLLQHFIYGRSNLLSKNIVYHAPRERERDVTMMEKISVGLKIPQTLWRSDIWFK